MNFLSLCEHSFFMKKFAPGPHSDGENNELHPSAVSMIQMPLVFSYIIISRAWSFYPALKSCCNVVYCFQLLLRATRGEVFHEKKMLTETQEIHVTLLDFSS